VEDKRQATAATEILFFAFTVYVATSPLGNPIVGMIDIIGDQGQVIASKTRRTLPLVCDLAQGL
jgi:hypothetical protein